MTNVRRSHSLCDTFLPAENEPWWDRRIHIALNYCAALPPEEAALCVAPRPSVCPSRAVFSIYWKSESVEISNLVETWPWTCVTGRANLRSTNQGQDHWERKYNNRFCAHLRRNCVDLHETSSTARPSVHTYRQRQCKIDAESFIRNS